LATGEIRWFFLEKIKKVKKGTNFGAKTNFMQSGLPFNVNDWLEKPVKRHPSSAQSKKFMQREDDASVLREPAIDYGASSINLSVLQTELSVNAMPMLAPQTTVPEFFMDNFEKVDLVKKGISKRSFEHFKAIAGLDYFQFAELLSVARNTLINKKGDETFSVDISEKLVALAEVYTHGISVFETTDVFKRWLQKPNRALGGVSPFSLLNTQYGRHEVHNVLGRIEWGVYS
jgi:putative toxin-antitoxin system antitoxin component (TIGR02293 family)